MKRFLLYCSLFILPFVVVLLPYFITDPFKVIYHYDNYYDIGGQGYYINTNRSYVSTMMYIQNKDKYHYDSFIFGSSRSEYFMVDDWKKYIPDSASCFHFDGSSESIYNIHKKLKYIDGKSPIRNVLICMERELLYQDKLDCGHLWVLPPCLEGDNFSAFHMAFIRAYLHPKFLRAYLDAKITGKVKPYMLEDNIFRRPYAQYDVVTNELSEGHKDVVQFPDSFYGERLSSFYERQGSISVGMPVIKENQRKMLYEIKEILQRNGTNYRIILNPIYNQVYFATEDISFLQDLFGDNLMDFSGKNRITDNYHYYSDPAHFNEYIANELMRIAYEPDSKKQKMMLDSLYYR